MTIKDFDRVRVGSEYPYCVDVNKIDYHESMGVYGEVGLFENHRVEVRKKGNVIAIFTFKYKDMDLPKWWRDSELIWENKEE